MLKLSLWNFKKFGWIAKYLFLLKSVTFWWHILMFSLVKGIWYKTLVITQMEIMARSYHPATRNLRIGPKRNFWFQKNVKNHKLKWKQYVKLRHFSLFSRFLHIIFCSTFTVTSYEQWLATTRKDRVIEFQLK